MEGQLQALGIAAERIGGVRPEEIDAELLKYQDAKKPGPYLAPPEIACALGHRKAWRRMLELDLPYALFLEDDSRLSSLLPTFLEEVTPVLSKLDVIRLETRMQRVTLGASTHRLPRTRIRLRRPLSEQWGLAGYILTAGCARRLLDDPKFFDAAIDHQFFDPISPLFSKINSRQCVPGLCTPAKGADYELIEISNIETERRMRFDNEKNPCISKRQTPSFFLKLKRESRRINRQCEDFFINVAGFLSATRITIIVPFRPGEKAT